MTPKAPPCIQIFTEFSLTGTYPLLGDLSGSLPSPSHSILYALPQGCHTKVHQKPSRGDFAAQPPSAATQVSAIHPPLHPLSPVSVGHFFLFPKFLIPTQYKTHFLTLGGYSMM